MISVLFVFRPSLAEYVVCKRQSSLGAVSSQRIASLRKHEHLNPAYLVCLSWNSCSQTPGGGARFGEQNGSGIRI